MAKSDFSCGSCKKVRGSDRRGNPTKAYKCPEHSLICRDCANYGSFFSRHRKCKRCDAEVIHQEFHRGYWHNA